MTISYTHRTRSDDSIARQALVRVRGAESVAFTFDDELDAKRWAEKTEADLEAQVKAARRLAKAEQKMAAASKTSYATATLRSAIEKYRDAKDGASVRQKASINAVLNNIDNVTLGDLNKVWAIDYVERMGQTMTYRGTPYSQETIHVHFQIMACSCRWFAALLKEPKPELPFSTKLFDDGWDEGRDRRLEDHEYATLMRCIRARQSPAQHHWRLLVRLALATGARLQELILSEWKEFHAQGRGLVWRLPAKNSKTRETRSIPLSKRSARLIKILRRMAVPGSKRLFHPISTPASASATFHDIVQAAGIVDFRFHDLRHEAVSRMVSNGKLRDSQIMKIVGHKSYAMMMRYTHLRADEMCELMD